MPAGSWPDKSKEKPPVFKPTRQGTKQQDPKPMKQPSGK